ncbi:hypothetical protein JSE7799_02513 [Jannaschia seosinensis]|uniref:Cell division and transport-associated protein TolA n=1 Tax=Jannaschia seosinensis TaxID=313367 RepID=A0A0M7BEJ7_9RHOB|nr:hypothetical protein [Jannaschia seosinensis]CUH39785.1 hypothetical protein JSE7799_02513 [Jannaschia seosinensis]
METRTAVAISGTAHAGLLGWALISGLFAPVPPEDSIEIAAVSVISSAEFDAMIAAAPADVPPAPVAPEAPATPDAPAPAPAEETPPPQSVARPETPAPSAPDAQPDFSQIAPPPQADVAADTPDAPAPPAAPADDPTAELSDRPAPRPADIVSTRPSPAPPPMVDTAPTVEAPPTPEPAEEEPAEPSEAPAAPEETAPIIVTEADTPGRAPESSTRPSRRPNRPTPVAAEEAPSEAPEEPEPPQQVAAAQQSEPSEPVEDTPAAIDTSAALAEARGGGTPAPAAPAGPPLTQGERDGLRVAVSRCWNVFSLSTEALRTTVTIYMQMDPNGVPNPNTLRLVGFEGGSQAAAQQAFEVGRRAIFRCGRDGFDLPPEKYEQWKEIEMSFDPSQMRLR